jgi:ankyrin repeat protein
MFKSYICISMFVLFISDVHAAAKKGRGGRLAKSSSCRSQMRADLAYLVLLKRNLIECIIDGNLAGVQQLVHNLKGKEAQQHILNNQHGKIMPLMASVTAFVLEADSAKKSNRMRIIELLLARGADPNIPCHYNKPETGKENYGLYPIHMAVEHQEEQLLASLLRAKARVNVIREEAVVPADKKRRINFTPLHTACNPRAEKMATINYGIVRTLLNAGAQVDVAYEGILHTPLHAAVMGGSLPVIELLLRAGAPTDRVDADGLAPIHRAVYYDDICTVWLLLRRAANIHQLRRHPDGAKHRQIMALSRTEDVQMLDALHAAFKDYSIFYEAYTPLHIAASSLGSLAMLRALLALGADPNRAAFLGICPLHIAVSIQDKEQPNCALIDTLLAAGADPNVWARSKIAEGNYIYCTPLLMALRMGIYPAVDTLIAWYKSHNLTLDISHSSCLGAVMAKQDLTFEQRCALVEQLIEIGDDVTKIDALGSVMHTATAMGEDPRMLAFLIAKGALLDQKNMFGMTPYECAISADDTALIEYLKPFEAAKLSHWHALATGTSIDHQEESTRRQFDPRIGDVTRLHEYAVFFEDTPGIKAILATLEKCGTGTGLKSYEPSRKHGALNTARGALFELNAAYNLLLARHAIKSLRPIYEGLEFDIETDDYLVECKNIQWSRITGAREHALKKSLQRHHEVVKRQGKEFMFYSRHECPEHWCTWLANEGIVRLEHKEMPSPSQNKIRLQYMTDFTFPCAQIEQCQRTSSSCQ